MPTQQEHSSYLNQLLRAIRDVQHTLLILQTRYISAGSRVYGPELHQRQKKFIMKKPVKCVVWRCCHFLNHFYKAYILTHCNLHNDASLLQYFVREFRQTAQTIVTNWLGGIFDIDETPQSPIDHVAKFANECQPLEPHDIVSELAQSLCVVLKKEHGKYDFCLWRRHVSCVGSALIITVNSSSYDFFKRSTIFFHLASVQ